MCKHENIQASLFVSFNSPYFAKCVDCGCALIVKASKTASNKKYKGAKRNDIR